MAKRRKLTEEEIKILGLLEELGEWGRGNWPPINGNRLRGLKTRGYIISEMREEGVIKSRVWFVRPDWKRREEVFAQLEAIDKGTKQ